MTILIPQDFNQPLDDKGSRKQIRPSDIKSGTYYGQLQLRGSILVIKDNLNTASGFMAFGSSMTTIPTSPTTGTGVYIDYRGIYGNASGTPQFYLQASDGKAYAGAGTVVLDANGISLDGSNNGSYLRWVNGSTARAVLSSDDAHGSQNFNIVNNSNNTVANGNFQISNFGGPSSNHSNTLYLYASDTIDYGFIGGSTFVGLYVSNAGIGGSFPTNPSALLHLQSTAPTLLMKDTTSSAKSLLVTVDGNKATFEEAAGTDVLVMDLANARVGIGTASPTNPLHVSSGATSVPLVLEYTGSSGNITAIPRIKFKVADGAAMASGDYLGGMFFEGAEDSGSNVGTGAEIYAKTTEAWSTTANGGKLEFYTTPNTTVTSTLRMTLDNNGSVILNSAAIATNATDGFLYIAACAGAPTGVPTAVTGRIPLVADSTNNKLYIYSGGAWVALN